MLTEPIFLGPTMRGKDMFCCIDIVLQKAFIAEVNIPFPKPPGDL
jgi:hypothetical protein